MCLLAGKYQLQSIVLICWSSWCHEVEASKSFQDPIDIASIARSQKHAYMANIKLIFSYFVPRRVDLRLSASALLSSTRSLTLHLWYADMHGGCKQRASRQSRCSIGSAFESIYFGGTASGCRRTTRTLRRQGVLWSSCDLDFRRGIKSQVENRYTASWLALDHGLW